MLIILGCLVDPISMMFLTIPLIVTPMVKMGVNPIWLGILVAKTLEIGAITPPMGMNCFMLKSTVKELSMPV